MSHSSNRYNPRYKHQESHQGNEEQSGNGFPGPPRDTHHSNQAIAGFSSSNRNTNQSSHQAMVGYSANHYNSNHSNSSNMDVDTSNSGRKQYSSNTNNTMKQDPSGRMMDERARRSSSHLKARKRSWPLFCVEKSTKNSSARSMSEPSVSASMAENR